MALAIVSAVSPLSLCVVAVLVDLRSAPRLRVLPVGVARALRLVLVYEGKRAGLAVSRATALLG
jgi:hypothetical protein